KVYKAVREDHSLTSFSAIKIISVPKNQAELGALHSEGMTESESKEFLEGVVSDSGYTVAGDTALSVGHTSTLSQNFEDDVALYA
ncbi:MAG: hypothetical protein IJC21_05695, partial [Lentisphaeria bacterium]|nr:hypothetical protein [Lentisphaeria bacterium]